jgi:hypothetical protein
MRGGRTPAAVGLLALFILGCQGGGSNTPMATEGPNQVVLKVPGMT